MKINAVLEVGEQYLKLALANPKGPVESRLIDCMAVPIANLTDDRIIKAVAEMFKQAKLKPQPVTLSLPRNFVTIRNLHLPSKDKKEITQMIDLHIPRIVPYRKEEVLFDHRFLGTDEMGYAKEILAIVHADALRKQARIVEASGMSVDRVFLSSYGAWRRVVAFHKSEMNANDIYLLLEIDSTFTDFIMFSRDNLLFTRSIALGANELAASGQAGLKKLLSDVRQSSIIFYNEELNKKPIKAFLSGATLAKDMHKTIESELNIPIKTVPLPYSQEMLKAKKRVIPESISFSSAAEFALETGPAPVSFVLPETQIRRSLKEKTRELTILGTLVIYLLTMILAIFLGRLYNQQSFLKELKEDNRIIEEDIGELFGQSNKIEFVKNYLYSRKLPLVLLYELQRVVPKEISLNLISMDEAYKVILRGEGQQLADVFKFVTTLENTKYFKGVATKYTRTKKVKDREITDFEIDFELTKSNKK